jgi:DNA-binding MarR family transcriptional regulator
VDEPRWLDDEQQRAWRRLAAVVLRLPAALEAQLQREAGMSHFEYWVLALLSEAGDRSLRLSELARQANASLSRLSHVVTRLQARGWVVREADPVDARATRAVLTDAGFEALAAAAPGHVERVRSAVFDGLGPDEVRELGRLCEAILAGIDAGIDAEGGAMGWSVGGATDGPAKTGGANGS